MIKQSKLTHYIHVCKCIFFAEMKLGFQLLTGGSLQVGQKNRKILKNSLYITYSLYEVVLLIKIIRLEGEEFSQIFL